MIFSKMPHAEDAYAQDTIILIHITIFVRFLVSKAG